MKNIKVNVKLNRMIYNSNDNSDYVARIIMSNLHAKNKKLICKFLR